MDGTPPTAGPHIHIKKTAPENRVLQGLADPHVKRVRWFVLGLIESDGDTLNATKFIRGAQGYLVFEKALNELLASVGE